MSSQRGLSIRQRAVKRAFDVAVAAIGLAVTWPVIVAAVALATLDTRHFGVFTQQRIGRDGVPFTVYKIRTMRLASSVTTTVTSATDARITSVGGVLRRLKIDELPQLVNVLRGDMSLVGPRPDVAGFADHLTGEDRVILTVRPGITGPATLAYRDEETVLAGVDEPETYNREVIWPAKVQMNREYVQHYSFGQDLRFIVRTISGR